MKLVIFGSTGRTGIPLVRQALDAGHEVVAFLRTPSKMPITDPALHIVEGDAMNADDVAAAITPDVHAVISVLAPSKNSPADMLPEAVNNIVSSMKANGITRLVYMTGAGVPAPQDEPGLFDHAIRFAMKTFTGDILRQSEEAVNRVRESGLDWTVVRAPMLTDGEHSGDYRVGWVGVNTGPRLARADAADFILSLVEEPAYLHKAPAVSN